MTLKTRSCLHKESSQHTKNHHRALTTCRAGCASARQFRSCNDKKKKDNRNTIRQKNPFLCPYDKTETACKKRHEEDKTAESEFRLRQRKNLPTHTTGIKVVHDLHHQKHTCIGVHLARIPSLVFVSVIPVTFPDLHRGVVRQ